MNKCFLALAGAMLLLAGCTSHPAKLNETGGMAYPQPNPAGSFSSTPSSAETGGMAQPAPAGGIREQGPTGETGGMAQPKPTGGITTRPGQQQQASPAQ
jgi:hypothetical protein